MSKYEYKDYKTLLDDITSGVYVIQQPIYIDNHPISFLGNLLNYSNIDKTNLHKILVSILNKIKTELFKQQLKKTGFTMVDHIKINGPFDKNKHLLNINFCDHDCECLGNTLDHIHKKEDYEKFIDELEEKFSDQKVYSKLLPEQDLNEYSVLELRNSVEDINSKCKTITDALDSDLHLINSERHKIDKIDLSLLDLSIKHICINN